MKWQLLLTSFPLIIVRQHVTLMRVCRSNSGVIKRQDGEMLSGANWPHKNFHINTNLIKLENGKRKLEMASQK